MLIWSIYAIHKTFSHKAIEVGKDIEIHVFYYWWSTYSNSSLNIIYKNEY
jgi:hypothetical protein